MKLRSTAQQAEDGEHDTIRLAEPNSHRYTLFSNDIMEDERLTPMARFLYVHLFKFAWKTPNNQGVFPGQQYLAIKLHISKRQLRVYIEELKACGLITVSRRGVKKTNLYTLHERVSSDYVGICLPPPKW